MPRPWRIDIAPAVPYTPRPSLPIEYAAGWGRAATLSRRKGEYTPIDHYWPQDSVRPLCDYHLRRAPGTVTVKHPRHHERRCKRCLRSFYTGTL